MASGFVKAELSICRHGRPEVTCRLLYKSVLLLVFWTHSLEMDEWVDSLGSNQECRIGYKNSHSRVSQCLAIIRKLGNRRSSEGLRSFKPSKGTNLFFLSTWLGISKWNQVPCFNVAYAKSTVRHRIDSMNVRNAKKRFHASCSKLGDNELLRIESGDGAWYCTNC